MVTDYTRRQRAILFDTTEAAGITLRPLSLSSWLTLRETANPLLLGVATPRDIVNYLWIHWPHHCELLVPLYAGLLQRWMWRRVKKHGIEKTVAEIVSHIDASLSDRPVFGETKDAVHREPDTHEVSWIIMALANHTGWSEKAIKDLPLGRLWQYLREHLKTELGERYHTRVFGPTDNRVIDNLEKQQAAFDAELEKKRHG